MIDPTRDMVSAAYERIDFVGHTWESVEEAVKAVVEIVNRDQHQPASVRERLDALLDEAIPVSGGRVREALKHLRWAFGELDKERAATAERMANWLGYQ